MDSNPSKTEIETGVPDAARPESVGVDPNAVGGQDPAAHNGLNETQEEQLRDLGEASPDTDVSTPDIDEK